MASSTFEDPEDFGRVEVAEVQRFADRDLSLRKCPEGKAEEIERILKVLIKRVRERLKAKRELACEEIIWVEVIKRFGELHRLEVAVVQILDRIFDGFSML